jgi:hypothetical protein
MSYWTMRKTTYPQVRGYKYPEDSLLGGRDLVGPGSWGGQNILIGGYGYGSQKKFLRASLIWLEPVYVT